MLLRYVELLHDGALGDVVDRLFAFVSVGDETVGGGDPELCEARGVRKSKPLPSTSSRAAIFWN